MGVLIPHLGPVQPTCVSDEPSGVARVPLPAPTITVTEEDGQGSAKSALVKEGVPVPAIQQERTLQHAWHLKNKLIDDVNGFYKYLGLPFNTAYYPVEGRLPHVPLESDIDLLISKLEQRWPPSLSSRKRQGHARAKSGG